ncbi:MAG: abortive infection family protein [Vicinamibacterales bacterium]
MADLTNIEKRQFERLMGMGGGYVLNFSNRTFAEFVADSVGRDISDARYAYGSGSKANLLRGFWKEETSRTVGRLLSDHVEYAVAEGQVQADNRDLDACRRTAARLAKESPVPELDALTALSDDRDFEVVAKAVRDAIDRNEPESGLDRLHTFVIKYVRSLCAARGIEAPRDKPLHSLFGEYLKRLREAGLVESEMSSRILKSGISVLEAFNDVRNNRSLAHDNPILGYEEALLIFNHIAASIRFLRSVESRLHTPPPAAARAAAGDDIPF